MKQEGLRAALAARISRAVVRLPKLGGLGVLVPGCFVVTAAHCIGWTAEGPMALGDYYREPIVTADGQELVVAPLAVEPISDLAVLGAMDEQEFQHEVDAFKTFCETTPPVPLAMDELVTFVSHRAYVFTHDQGVIEATVQLNGPAVSSLWLHSEQHIDGETSGGPVVTPGGRLWGIVSQAGATNDEGPCDGPIPRVHLAGPGWVVRRMIPGHARRKLDAALPPGGFAIKRRTPSR